MIFKSIKIIEGKREKKIDFSESANLVHSVENSKGKTTLLRFLLYSIGYAIPSTKNIRFEECITETILDCAAGTLLVERRDSYLLVKRVDNQQYFILPQEASKFHSMIYGTENHYIMSNILGAFYIDQEKGWTLLNRGCVIGKNHFNIQELVLGLSNRDYSDLFAEAGRIERELSKYKQMFSVAQYQKDINELKENLVFEEHDESIKKEIEVFTFDYQALSEELSRINKVINENSSFRKYIEKMRIRVKAPNGEEIPVNKDTIVDFIDSVEILLAKRKMITSQMSGLQEKIANLNLYKQSQFSNKETIIQNFDRNILSFQMDSRVINSIITELETRLTVVKKEISDMTKKDNPILIQMYDILVNYVPELHLEKHIKPSIEYLFTSNLKELSGAILHKIVFIFKLAYINAIQSTLNIKLPLILDSPSGKEVDSSNVDDMMRILNRDFKANQVIIASIHNYTFDKINTIELGDRLID